MMGMAPDVIHINQEFEERLLRSDRLRRAAEIVRRQRARNSLRRAIETSLRSGFERSEVASEFALSLNKANGR